MQTQPQTEHQWLQKLVGEWAAEMNAIMEPGQPPVQSKGIDKVRSLGGLWVLAEGEGEMPEGGCAGSIMTLGFDPAKKRFVGTFVASMMTHLWVYDGVLDESGNVLTLDTEGPSMTGGGMAKYQDRIEFKSADHRTLTSRILLPDRTWSEFMTAHYRRTK